MADYEKFVEELKNIPEIICRDLDALVHSRHDSKYVFCDISEKNVRFMDQNIISRTDMDMILAGFEIANEITNIKLKPRYIYIGSLMQFVRVVHQFRTNYTLVGEFFDLIERFCDEIPTLGVSTESSTETINVDTYMPISNREKRIIYEPEWIAFQEAHVDDIYWSSDDEDVDEEDL